jgi:hypothetical protein
LFHEVTVLPGSSRGDGGFGSTGRGSLRGRVAPSGSGGSPGGSPPRGR